MTTEATTGAAATSTGATGTTTTEQTPEQKAAADAAAKATTDAAAAAAKKTADDAAAKKAADDLAAGKVAQTAGAPEKYVLKVPDAGKTFFDDADLKQLETMARAANWTNEDAQAALEEHVATIQAQSDRWQTQTAADATYGGDHLAETKRLADVAIARVRPAGHARRAGFLAFLNRGGAGNHLEVVSFLADLGKLMGEDSTTGGRGSNTAATGDKRDPVSVLYGEPK